MKFISTKQNSPAVSASDAILQGVAPDGGLYVPQSFPHFAADDFADAATLPALASILFAPFFAGDRLATELPKICQAAFNFPAPTRHVTKNLDVLELFHGPTAAFKDFGARFMAQCIEFMSLSDEKLTILVATSGDTGGAVGCAYEQAKTARVVILYPKGRVSPFQQHQLTCWGDNVTALEVDGDFDDCQRLVKQAFADDKLNHACRLGSANSINIARLLPQMSYYAFTALAHFKRTGNLANFIIPTGNMGNGMACLWAKTCGLPIGDIIFATNANRALSTFFATGELLPHPSVSTLANAMDVGNPSNLERYRWQNPQADNAIRCQKVSDGEISTRIRDDYKFLGQTWCPHTAIAAQIWQQLPAQDKAQHWYIVSTAHPYKFREVVEPLIKTSIAPPAAMQDILQRKSIKTAIPAEMSALRRELLRLCG
ncbi:Threonine synthase [hydrothermal vent metagenome]|uniref:threonine synthase n=1 Tax=hydrothermal vent metagenome TaxID=652676 RepID=A0A3B0S3E7_9ZZZZ